MLNINRQVIDIPMSKYFKILDQMSISWKECPSDFGQLLANEKANYEALLYWKILNII